MVFCSINLSLEMGVEVAMSLPHISGTVQFLGNAEKEIIFSMQMPEIEVPTAGVHSRAGRQRKRKEPEVVDERTARLQKRMVTVFAD